MAGIIAQLTRSARERSNKVKKLTLGTSDCIPSRGREDLNPECQMTKNAIGLLGSRY